MKFFMRSLGEYLCLSSISQKMSNPFAIARKLCVRNSLISRSIDDFSRKFTTRNEKPSKRRLKKHGHNLSEQVMTAIKMISINEDYRISKRHTLYLLDETVAKKFASLVVTNRTSNSSHVIEINPGLGYLTKELLDTGIPSIHLFDGIRHFVPEILSLRDKYPNRVRLSSVDFYHIWKVGYVDWKDCSEKMDEYFSDVKKRAWNDEPAIEIIASLADMDFINRLTATMVYQNSLCKYGRIIVYAAVPPSVWAHLTCTNEHYDLYRPRIIMFQALFQYELLGSLPRSVFYPPYKQHNKKTRSKCRLKIRRNDDTLMHVVKIEAKADIFNEDFSKNEILSFYYFVNYHLISRKNRIIPALEKWIPGCGRTLIARGYDIFTEFGELTPQEIINLFKEFRSWPGYKKSSFISCMETFLMKMDEHIVLDSTLDEINDFFQSSLDEEHNETSIE